MKNFKRCKMSVARVQVGHLVPAGLAAVALSVIPPAVAEQETGSKMMLEEVIVSARRQQESLQTAPVSVVAVPAEQLQNMGISNLSELDSFIPNLSTGTAQASSGWASLTIRGIGGGQGQVYQESGVGIYIDDIYYPRMQGALLEVIDVEQVEVLRGPQGTLFGKNTTGGAIRYTSAKPNDELGGRVTATAGEYDRRDITALVNVPFTETLAGRFTVTSNNRDGFVRALSTGNVAGNIDIRAARAQFRWMPSDRLDWGFSVDVLESKNDGVARDIPILDSGSLFPRVVPDPRFDQSLVTADRYTVAGGPKPDSMDSKTFGVSNTIEFELMEDLTFKSLTGYRDSSQDVFYDADLTPVKVFDTYLENDFDSWSQEFQFNGNALDSRLKFATGVYYMEEKANDLRERESDTFPPTNSPRSYEIETKTLAVYGQGTWQFTEKLSTTIGLRWSEDEKDLTTFDRGLGSNSGKWDAVTSRFGLEYQATDDIMAFVSAARGFKSGGFNPSPSVDLLEHDPEYVWTYESGLRSEFADGRARVNVTAFYSDFEDIIISDIAILNGGPQTILNNAGAAEIKGIEMETLFALTESLTLGISGGWLDAEYTEVGSSTTLTLDTPLPRTPEWSYAINLAHDHSLENGAQLSSNLSYGWKDDQSNNDSDTNRITLPSYGLLNARISYTLHSEQLTLSLVGTNLLDEEYLVGGFDPTTREGILGYVQHDLGRPREIGVELNFTW